MAIYRLNQKVSGSSNPAVSFSDITGQPTDNTSLATALNGKVNIETGKGLSTNDFTDALETKLNGIETGAEVNVLESVKDSSGTALTITDKAVTLSKSAVGLGNVDNTADSSKIFDASQVTSGVFGIARIPTGSTSSTVCVGDDSRLSDTRTPKTHASTHNKNGTDALSLDANQITTGTFDYNRIPVGSATNTICAGDDGRLSDARTPTSHASTHSDGGSDEIAIDTSQVTSGTFADARIPSLAASKITSGVFDIARIPPAALERLVTVADDTARFALTTSQVQNGDSVYVTATSKLYIVVDDTQLSTEAGYMQYRAYVSWDSIDNKPSTYAPSAHASTHATGGTDAVSIDTSQVTSGTFAIARIPTGSTSSTVCIGNDSRLSDSRTPTTHASSHTDGTDDIQTASSSQKGLLSSSDWSTFNSKQDEITSSNKLLSDLVDTTSQTNLFVTSSEKTTWNSKQSAITSSNMLSSDLVDDTNKTNLFVTSSEKSTWNGKQNALTFDSTPTASSTNPVTSGGVYTALSGKQAQHTTATATLTVAGWSSLSQTVSVSGVTASNTVFTSPEGSSYTAYVQSQIRCTGQGAGTLTFECNYVPSSAVTINVVVLP